MPITLKKDEWKVKDPSSGNYRGAAILSTTLPEDAAQIIEDTENALDAEEVRAGQIINDAQNAVDGIEGQSSLIQQKVANAVLNGNNYELIDTAVESWLDIHPEATTTVQDGSLTEAKLSESLALKTIKDYVTPQLFGAKGDGITDDTAAFQALSGKTAYIPEGTYIVSHVEYARKTALFGAGMGKSVIQQKAGATGDLFDFVDADCSSLCNVTLLGNKNEVSSDIYRALLKIRTTRTSTFVNYSHYCNFEHIVVRNASASGIVLLGRSSADPVHPNSNHNWVHHFNDLRVEECNLWCMIDQTSDNLFSNLYLNEGDLGNLLCSSSSNMYVNLKLDQPYGGGGSGSLDGFNDGALILLRGCDTNRFVNIDLQSSYYVGAKIYNSKEIHFDGDINNVGLGAGGHGIGLLIGNSNHCTFNLSFHKVNTDHEHNVKILPNCFDISVYANQYYKTENPNACPDSCFIVDPSSLANLYNSKFDTTQTMHNLFANPLCDTLNGWNIYGNVTLDTSGKTVGANSIKVIGEDSSTIQVSQNFSGLNPGDCYMALAVVNIEQLATSYADIKNRTPYIVMATNNKDSNIYSTHKYAPYETGTHLIAQVGQVSETGILQVRFYTYKNNGIYYFGNFMLFNLTDLGIAIPAKLSTYNMIYTKLKNVMNLPFSTVNITWDYTQIMGILKHIVSMIS